MDAQEPCELVVVDDGSDDPDTLAVLDELRSAGRRVLRQRQSGPGGARMNAVRATSAPYVFALDSDDLLPPGALTALADTLDASPGAALAWGEVESFGAVAGPGHSPRTLDPWLITYVDEFVGTGLIRREALLRAGGWRPGGSFENWDLLMGLCEQRASGVRVDQPILRYRIGEARRLGQMQESFEEIYSELRHHHQSLFASRRKTWRSSSAPWRSRLLFPLIERLPFVSMYTRYRIAHVVHRPSTLGRAARRWLGRIRGVSAGGGPSGWRPPSGT